MEVAVESTGEKPFSNFMLLLRFCALFTFLCYLFAGASFVLPATSNCARCSKIGQARTVKPGASCPLSQRGHHCHTSQKHPTGTIVMCPDGCLHHNSQDGAEVTSLAKFLSALWSAHFALLLMSQATAERQFPLQELFLSPPDRPPSVSL
jgi:hypothetical protein